MERILIALLISVVCSIIVSSSKEKAQSQPESGAEAKVNKSVHNGKRTRICLIAILVLWGLAAIFAIITTKYLKGIAGVVLCAWLGGFAYLVLWLLFYRHREKRIDDVLMLFIPIFAFGGTLAYSWGPDIYLITAIGLILITVVLTVLSFVQKPDMEALHVRNKYMVIMVGTAFLFVLLNVCLTSLLGEVDSNETTWLIHFLKNNPLYLLALLLIMFFVFLFIGREKSGMDSV